MNERTAPHFLLDRRDAIEGRFALRLTSGLTEAGASLPHDISERLRFSRERALARAKVVRETQAARGLSELGGGVAALGGGPSIWLRLVSLLPLVVLVVGFVLIQQHNDSEQIAVAAEIDAALLADAVPPDAYRDPGFAAFLQAHESR